MKINLGRYLESCIKSSNYSKKELCDALNELFVFGDKHISYPTFSNNIRNGEITINEAVAMATLIEEINLNKIVLICKNELIKNNSNSVEVIEMKNKLVKIFNENSTVGIKEYKSENIYEIIRFEVYEALYVSEDYKVAAVERVDLTGVIQEVAHFIDFDKILAECGMTVSRFEELPLNEKIDFLATEGQNALDILGRDMKEEEFHMSGYDL